MKLRSLLLFLIGLLIAAYGAFVFIDRDFPTYLFLQSEFVFLDYGEPIWSFYLDYISLMGLWVFLAHYLSKGKGSRPLWNQAIHDGERRKVCDFAF